VLASSKTLWIAAPCPPSTFPPVKRGRDNLDLKCNCKFFPSASLTEAFMGVFGRYYKLIFKNNKDDGL